MMNDMDMPKPTCQMIDQTIEFLEQIRNDNAQLRYGHDCMKTLLDESLAELKRHKEAIRVLRDANQSIVHTLSQIDPVHYKSISKEIRDTASIARQSLTATADLGDE